MRGAWAAGLLLLTVVVLAPVRGLDFVNYDDPVYVTENPHVLPGVTPAGLERAVRPFHGNWHPLTLLSHMLDVEMFGLDPRGHHLTSLVLHAAGVLLLYVALLVTTGRPARSALVAALFAVHPLNVQSVAWIAERKNVLSTVFWWLALWAHARHVRAPGAGRYALVLAAFLFGLASKPMVVTLPLTLLLVDVWMERERRDGWVGLLLEKVPMLVAAAVVGLITISAQTHAEAIRTYPLPVKVATAVAGYGWYVLAAAWPSGLSVFYPHPGAMLPASRVAAGAVVLLALVALAVTAGRRHRFVLFGAGWYVLTLLPVIGIVQAGEQAHADRYAYVPLVGIFVLVVWGLAELAPRLAVPRPVLAGAAAVAVLAAAVVSSRTLDHWKDSESLFRQAVRVDPDNVVARGNLGMALVQRGRLDEAVSHFEHAIRVDPRSHTDHLNLGNTLALLGRFAEARHHLEEATRLDPADPRAQFNLGLVLLGLGDPDGARQRFARTLELAPGHERARAGLARLGGSSPPPPPSSGR